MEATKKSDDFRGGAGDDFRQVSVPLELCFQADVRGRSSVAQYWCRKQCIKQDIRLDVRGVNSGRWQP